MAFGNTDAAKVVDDDFGWLQDQKRHQIAEVDLMVEVELLNVVSMASLSRRPEREAETLDG